MSDYDLAYSILSIMVGLTAVVTAFFVRKEMKDLKRYKKINQYNDGNS